VGRKSVRGRDVLVLSDAVECSFMFGHLLIVNKLIVNKLPLSKTLHAVHIEEEEEEEGRDMLRFHLFFSHQLTAYTHTQDAYHAALASVSTAV
jgi:sirohydrochlorin ferrochelatase